MQHILKISSKKVLSCNQAVISKKLRQFKLTKQQKLSAKNIIISLVGGLFVGFLNGFFGGGGGMIVVPLFTFLLGLSEKHAHATAIFTILPISVASSIIYILNKNVPFEQLGYATAGFVVGGVVGAFLLKKINNKWLRIIFALIMIGAGIKILI